MPDRLLLAVVVFCFSWFCQLPAAAERLHCSVREELPSGALVCDLAEKLLGRPISPQQKAHDLRAQFQLLSGGTGGVEARRRFALDADSGRLTLAERLDRESIQHCRGRWRSPCRLELTATFLPNQGSDIRLLDLSVSIEDVNDNAPKFPALASVHRFRLREHDRSARLRLPRAADPDAGRNGTVRYSFTRPSALFVLEEQSVASSSDSSAKSGHQTTENTGSRIPVLRLVREVDLEAAGDADAAALRSGGFTLVVQAWDEGQPPRAGGNLTVLVSVENTNDFAPEFDPASIVQWVTVKENASLNSLLYRASATDRDYAAAGRLSYSLRSPESPQQLLPFRIDPISGEIRLLQLLDAEDRQEFRFEVVVSDNHNPEPRTAAMSLTVKVEDVNDNQPSIEVITTSSSGGLTLPENHPPKLIGYLLVTDRDRDSRHQPPPDCDLAGFHDRTDSFELTPEPAVKSATKILRLLLHSRRPLDREEAAEHRLWISCVDAGGLSTESRFIVRVLDQNDSPPAFPTSGGFIFRLPENLPAGAAIGRAEASDPDEAAETVYSVLAPCDRLVGVGQRNASLYTLAPLDREVNASLRCHLLATDAAKPELSAVAVVRIDVDDVNDCAPVFRQQSDASDGVRHFRVSEAARPGFAIGKMAATDADSGENGRLSFALLPAKTSEESAGASAFRLSAAGELLLLGSLDRERRSRHRLRVIARDHGRPPLSAKTIVEIDVEDVNDNAPSFVFPPAGTAAPEAVVNVSVRERPGARVAHLSAVDPDAGDNGSIEFRIVSGGGGGVCEPGQFSLESDTGRLLLVRPPPHSSVLCALSVEALDRGRPPLRSSGRLLINFTDIRPRGTSLLSGTPGGGGSGEAEDGGARDLVVVTVCVAVSFLVLLCAVTLAGYFCYYMQLRRSPRGTSAAAGTIADDFQGVGLDGTGSRSSAWLSRVSLGNGSGKRLRRPTTASWLRGGLGDGLISDPMPIKSASEVTAAVQESHYTADRGIIGRLASFDARCQTLADCATERRTGRPRGRQHPAGDYQALTGTSAAAAPHNGNWSVDAKGGYKSLARPPSTEPAQRRGTTSSTTPTTTTAAVEPTAASSAATVAAVMSMSMSLATMQPQQAHQLQQRTLGSSGYVYGSPYLTSSFV